MRLHYTLKKVWFDMTQAKIKREEYRDITLYWAARLLYKIEVPWGGSLTAWKDIIEGDSEFKGWKAFTGGAPVFREFTEAFMRNGYAKDAPAHTEQIESISIGEGREEWGAVPGKKYFVIRYKG